MAFDVQSARAAGYSETEIADYLSGQRKFDAPGARKAGYSDADIIGHLEKAPAAAAAAAAAPRAPPPAAAPPKKSVLDGAPTAPLAGAGRTDLGSRVLQIGDQLGRTYGGAAADLADAAAGLINRPINSVLRTAGVDYQLPDDQLGSRVAQPVGAVPQVSRALAPFLVGTGGVARGLEAAAPRAVEVLTGAQRGRVAATEAAAALKAAPRVATPIATGIAAGAPVDAAMSSKSDKNLSNIVQDLGGPQLPTARVQGENPGIASLKDMAEGMVVGATVEKVLGFFTHGPKFRPGTPEAGAEAAEVEQAMLDPRVKAQLDASGIAAESPRYQEFTQRVQERQAAEAAARDPQSVIARAVSARSPAAPAAPELPDTFYQGTTNAFDKQGPPSEGMPGTFVTDDPLHAGLYALGEGGNIRPVKVRSASPLHVKEDLSLDDTAAEAFGQGHDSVVGTDSHGKRVVVLKNHSQVRSVFDESGRPTTPPATLDQAIDGLEALRRAPNLPPATRADLEAAILGDLDPSRVRAPAKAPPPEVIAVDSAGRADTGDLAIRTGADLRKPSNLPVPTEAPTPRMSDAEIAQAQRAADAGRTNPVPEGEPLRAPEGRAPQTREDVAAQRDAGGAFALADRQRQRVAPEVRDTQTAGLPEGPQPQRVLMDEGFPVKVVEDNGRGRVKVQRYDPRTGEVDPDAVAYDTHMAGLSAKSYTPEPRTAQDFAARDNPARMSPEEPRSPAGPVAREPTQTYRATPDVPPRDGGPPFPDQPEGPMPGPSAPSGEHAQRAANEEELRARYEQARSDQQYQDFSSRARESYKVQDAKGSPVAGAKDADSRFPTDDFGFVKSDKGGPVRFGDQKQAAKWILNVGHKESPDQIFEIANGPKGGFTVRETGRGSPPEGGAKVDPAPEMKEAPPVGEAPVRSDVSAGGRMVASPEEAARAAPPESPTAGRESEQAHASDVGSQGTTKDVPARAEPTSEPERPAAAPSRATAEPSDAEIKDLYAKHFGPGRKLYSNPLDPEAIKEHLLDPAVQTIKKEIDGFKHDLEQIKADLKGVASNLDGGRALDATARTVRKVWWSNVAAIRATAAKYKDVPEVRQLADWIGTDPGRGRVVEQVYERAVQMRAMGMANRLHNIVGEKVKPELEEKVADILAGRRRAVGGTAEEEMARRTRKLLDEQHDYMKDAGLDVGYVKGRYYPRVIDEQAVLKDVAGFKTKAAGLYRGMGLSSSEAADAAEDWYSRILGVSDGAYSAGLPSARHTKGRTLPAEADKLLADFYVKDPRANLTAYFRQTSRAAEFARRFGPNGEKADELFNAMLKKGVDPKDIENLRHHFESSTGQLYATRPDAGAAALSWIQTAGVLRLLPRAVISSAVEGLSVGVRAHDVGAGFKALADSYATLFKMREPDEMQKVAELLGIVGDAMNDMVISAQFGGEVGGLAQQKLMARFFRVTHLHQITEAQRLAAARVGQGMLRTLLQDLEGTKRVASAKRLLAELGMNEAGAKAVSAWLGKNKGMPPMAELTGTGKEAKLYRTALQRFVDESIQNPTAADKPQWASHPFGRLAYGITSFMFSFTRNVLVRTARETTEGVFGKGYTLEDRARLLAPAIALGVLTAAQGQVSELRDALLNPQAQGEKSKTQKLMTNLSRAGAFGNADPFINIAMSARYNRDLTSTLTGPYLTAYLDSIAKLTVGLFPKSWGGPNSPNTNNAEWQASKAAYEMIASPLIAAAASYAPGGPVLRVGYGAGLVSATAPGASRAFADAVAGERKVKPRVSDLRDDTDAPEAGLEPTADEGED